MTNVRGERGGGQADDTNAESVATEGNEGEGRMGKGGRLSPRFFRGSVCGCPFLSD